MSAGIDLAGERGAIEESLRAPSGKVFLRDARSAWTWGELRAAADGVAAGLLEERGGAEGFPPVGVYVRSPFRMAACVLGAWKARFDPILVDPSSKTEIGTLTDRFPRLRLLAEPDHLPASGGIPVPPPAEDRPIAPPGLRDPLVSFFTSGSEGKPKLVPKVSRQVYAHAASVVAMLGIPSSCRALSFVPLFHILGFSYGLIVPLRAGGEVLTLPGEPPAAMLRTLVAYRPQVVIATAVHYRFLNAVLTPRDDIPDAIYISSGAPLFPSDRDEFQAKTGRAINELFGSTETGGIARRMGDMAWTPYPGVEFRIEDDVLFVRSPWAHLEDQDAWVRTHDAVEADGAGFRLLGRSGNLAKIGGKRFSTLEVEHCLRSCPGVEDAAAVLYERGTEPALAAFVTLSASSPPSLADVRSFLAARLAPFKIPRILRALPSLPRGKIEKLDYAELRRLAGSEETAGRRSPAGPSGPPA